MHKLSKCIDRKSLETIYESYVWSKLEYACIVWDDCSEQDHLALEKRQLTAARIVTGTKKGTVVDILCAISRWNKSAYINIYHIQYTFNKFPNI